MSPRLGLRKCCGEPEGAASGCGLVVRVWEALTISPGAGREGSLSARFMRTLERRREDCGERMEGEPVGVGVFSGGLGRRGGEEGGE